jgi:hypothetical protein
VSIHLLAYPLGAGLLAEGATLAASNGSLAVVVVSGAFALAGVLGGGLIKLVGDRRRHHDNEGAARTTPAPPDDERVDRVDAAVARIEGRLAGLVESQRDRRAELTKLAERVARLENGHHR